MPRASLIILCHNALAYTRRCLQSVQRNTRGSFELILVDNGSSDGTDRYLKKFAGRSRNTRLMLHSANLGFSRGNNLAIEQSRGTYPVLLNNDTIVTPGWLEGLIRCAETDPAIGAVGPMTNNAADIAQRVDRVPYRTIAALPAFSRRWTAERKHQIRFMHRLIGFCLLLRREAIERVGLLDERFHPGGYEDYDYCLRLRQAGYKIALAQDIYIHHFGQKSYSSDDYRRKVVQSNREVFLDKWCRKTLEFLDDLDKPYG